MNPARTILAPTDFSDLSGAALEVAVDLAAHHNARLAVLHVAPVVEAPGTAESASLDPAGPNMHLDVLGERLERLEIPGAPAEAVAPGPRSRIERMLREGDPATQILRAAAEVNADLIVMGTHGGSGLRRFLLGSVAETVVRRSSCPVLTLGAPAWARGDGGNPPEIRTVLHPTDFSEGARAALLAARTVAKARKARLILVHVMREEIAPHGLVSVELDVADVRETLEELGRFAAGPDGECQVETRLIQGDPASEILRVAHEVPCDLIVIGSHGRTGLARVLMGSIAEAVVRGAGCPVLTVKVAPDKLAQDDRPTPVVPPTPVAPAG